MMHNDPDGVVECGFEYAITLRSLEGDVPCLMSNFSEDASDRRIPDVYATDGPFYYLDANGNFMVSAHSLPGSNHVNSPEVSVIPYENANQGPIPEYNNICARTTPPVDPGSGQSQSGPVTRGVELPSVKKPVVASDRVRVANEMRRQPGKKLYHCMGFSPCTATFTARHNLRNHINSHLGVKPYTCDFCSKATVTKSDIKRHAKYCKHNPSKATRGVDAASLAPPA